MFALIGEYDTQRTARNVNVAVQQGRCYRKKKTWIRNEILLLIS